MNLVIDIGNTRVKAALYKEDLLEDLKIYESVDELLEDNSLLQNAQQIIVGSVVDKLEDFYRSLKAYAPTLLFTSTTKIPLSNLYHSVSTLGSDRISASVAAYFLQPDSDVLVIDAGTCIKYNFTNAKNEYLGGGISPGIQMRFKSLHEHTSKLPLIGLSEEPIELIGTSTQHSILSGVVNGTVAEIDGLIDQYKIQFPKILVLLTGGDSEYLAKRLKNSIFAHQNLVLKGLNDILNYNLANT
ncbi:MAG: coaX [Bacteroidetes bacterium]|jgi:type III pantothenate kinase|nr:coaX [Bacteroidota bacterium]MDF2451277.1 coaX [Bacteroidota bacterium]